MKFTLTGKTVQLIPLPETSNLNCPAPAVPAKIELAYDLALKNQNLAVFEPATPKSKGIIVRRGGQISQSTNGNLPSRFVSKPPERASEADHGNLIFRARLYFCEYLGFLTFMQGEYAVATKIGEYSLLHEDIQAPANRGELSLEYQIRKWASVKDGVLVPFQYTGAVDANEIGLLRLHLRLDPATFTHQDQGTSIEAQLSLTANLTVAGTKVKK